MMHRPWPLWTCSVVVDTTNWTEFIRCDWWSAFGSFPDPVRCRNDARTRIHSWCPWMPCISGTARFCASSYPLSAVTTRSSPMSFLSVLCPSPTQHHSTTLLRIPSRPFLTLKQHIFRAIIDRSSSQQSINPNPFPFKLFIYSPDHIMPNVHSYSAYIDTLLIWFIRQLDFAAVVMMLLQESWMLLSSKLHV